MEQHRIVRWAAIVIALAVGARAARAAPAAPAAPAQQVKLGAFTGEHGGFAVPADAVWDDAGRLLVLEADRDRVTVLDAAGAVESVLGGTGDGPGQFRDPRALELGPDGRLYVADTGNQRIQVFGAERREFLLAFGSFGSGAGSLSSPSGLAVTAGEVFVADSGNDRIAVFDLDGRALRSFGTWGGGAGEFRRPRDVTVDEAGDVFVADSWNHRVQKLDARGEPLAAWGDFGPHPGFFATPTGITYRSGQLFVADRDNHRIQVFDTDGALLYAWGLHAILPHESAGKLHYPDRVAVRGTADGPSEAVVVEGFEDRLQFFGPTEDGAEPPAAGSLGRSVATHYGGAVDSAGGWMSLVEPTRPAVLIWDDATDIAGLEPINISRVSAWGGGFGQFRMPVDAAVDPARSLLFVCDPGNLRLDAWRIDRDEGPIKNQPDLLQLAFSIDLTALPVRFEHHGPIEATALELDRGGAVEGGVLIADARSRSVIEIGTAPDPDSGAATLAAWRRWPEPGREALLEATDLALSPDGERLYVADRIGGCVRVFPRAGDGASFSFRGPDNDPLVRPAGICVDGGGAVYVTDAARHRIAKFDADGQRLAVWGKQGLGRLEFFKPRGIAVRADGNLVVIDHGNHRGQILSPEGEFLHVFGSRLFIQPAQQ